MKRFESRTINYGDARSQLEELNTLLSTQVISEKELLEFFRSRRDLIQLIGRLNANSDARNIDSYASEFNLFGDYRTDFAVGDSSSGQYLLIELEPAMDCIFTRKNDWHPRFSHGYNQLIDWFWLMDDQRQTSRFGDVFPNFRGFTGLLVIGRDAFLDETTRRRIDWRTDNCLTDSKKINIITYDKLYLSLKREIDFYTSGAT